MFVIAEKEKTVDSHAFKLKNMQKSEAPLANMGELIPLTGSRHHWGITAVGDEPDFTQEFLTNTVQKPMAAIVTGYSEFGNGKIALYCEESEPDIDNGCYLFCFHY